jgi:hypothetical protein
LSHSDRCQQNMKMQIIVMPAWMAGTQVRKDASGDIHVGLDSTIPCWNDAVEGSSAPTDCPAVVYF